MKKTFIFFFVLVSFISFQTFGQTWSGLKRLTWNTGDSYVPSMAVDSGNGIHVVWEDLTPGNYEIFYKSSSNSGVTWSGLIRLTWNVGLSRAPSIAAGSSSGIHVVWQDDTKGNDEIFYKRSTDGGNSWVAIKRLTWNAGDSNDPSLAIDSSTGIHVVWTDFTPGDQEIFYRRSTNGGITWPGSTRLTWNAGCSSDPSIATDSGSGIHVVWWDSTPGNQEIFYKHSTDNGATWSVPRRMTWNTGSSLSPSIAADSGSGIHVVWPDITPGNLEVFYKKSTDGGVSWLANKRLTWNGDWSGQPIITTDSGSGIYVVWCENKSGNYEIFFKQSSDSGVTWSGLTRLTWNSGGSRQPYITTDSGNGIHVVWCDYTPGNFEIFYKNRK